MLRWPGRCLDRIVHLFRAHGVRSSCRKRDKILLLLDPSLLIRDTPTVLSVLTRRTDPCGGYSKRRDRVTARPSRVFMCRRLSSWDQTPLTVDPREDTPPHPVFEASVQTARLGGGMDTGTGASRFCVRVHHRRCCRNGCDGGWDFLTL